MKHNWQYKKLGEICEVIGGSTPNTEIAEYWNGTLNWFTPAELSDKKYYNSSERKITEEAVRATGLTLMPPGTVLLTSRAPIGKVGIATDYFYCNQGFKNLVCKEGLYNEYLYYALIYFREEIKEKGRGATFKEISKRITETITIPLPPLEEQQRIVAELDRINAVMEDCRQLLRTLDALAQSLFYDSFGDPISNPKAWPTENFGNLCRLSAGGDKPEDAEKEQSPEKSIPIYSNGIEDEGLYGFTSKPRISEPCITISGRGTLGVPFIRKSPFVPIIRLIVAIPNKRLNLIYLYYLTKLLNLKGKGAAIPQLTVPMIKGIQLPVPPLELQQQFARRIEAIDARKKAVEKTIATLQTLLDSRMDYWFN